LTQLMIQGEARVAEPTDVGRTNPTHFPGSVSGLERSDTITVTFGHRRADCALLQT
jgi:hypothetical protein